MFAFDGAAATASLKNGAEGKGTSWPYPSPVSGVGAEEDERGRDTGQWTSSVFPPSSHVLAHVTASPRCSPAGRPSGSKDSEICPWIGGGNRDCAGISSVTYCAQHRKVHVEISAVCTNSVEESASQVSALVLNGVFSIGMDVDSVLFVLEFWQTHPPLPPLPQSEQAFQFSGFTAFLNFSLTFALLPMLGLR